MTLGVFLIIAHLIWRGKKGGDHKSKLFAAPSHQTIKNKHFILDNETETFTG